MSETRESLRRKRLAYLRTFCGDGNAPHPEGQRVLADLRKHCGLTRGGIVVSPKTGTVDPYATIYRAAMRDVYLRISGFLSLDEATLFQEPNHVEAKTETAG